MKNRYYIINNTGSCWNWAVCDTKKSNLEIAVFETREDARLFCKMKDSNVKLMKLYNDKHNILNTRTKTEVQFETKENSVLEDCGIPKQEDIVCSRDPELEKITKGYEINLNLVVNFANIPSPKKYIDDSGNLVGVERTPERKCIDKEINKDVVCTSCGGDMGNTPYFPADTQQYTPLYVCNVCNSVNTGKLKKDKQYVK